MRQCTVCLEREGQKFRLSHAIRIVGLLPSQTTKSRRVGSATTMSPKVCPAVASEITKSECPLRTSRPPYPPRAYEERNHAKMCVNPRKRNKEGEYPENPMSGHKNTPHKSQDQGGQDGDGELSKREGGEPKGRKNRCCS